MKTQAKKLLVRKLLLPILAVFLSQVALGQSLQESLRTETNQSTIDEEHSDERLNLLFMGSFLSVSNADLGTDLTGIGASFQAIYNITSDFGLGGGAGTVMSSDGGGAATVLNWAFTYAVTGSLSSSQSRYRVNGKRILEGKNSSAEGLRVQMLFSQYYFNGTESTVPFAGVGGQLFYQKYLDFVGLNTVLAIRIDQLFNNEVSLMPMTIGIGAIF